jgi:peptidoglycan/LPS O-acetylase OafA/YrhL
MGVETTDVRLASVIAIATLGALLISSRCLYIYFERPARNWFRERFKRSSKEADGYRSPRRALP